MPAKKTTTNDAPKTESVAPVTPIAAEPLPKGTSLVVIGYRNEVSGVAIQGVDHVGPLYSDASAAAQTAAMEKSGLYRQIETVGLVNAKIWRSALPVEDVAKAS